MKITSFDTVDERTEKFLSWKDRLPSFHSRNVELDPNNNVCAIVKNVDTGYKEWNYTHNIVTNDGDIYYAKMGADETPATNAGGHYIQNASTDITFNSIFTSAVVVDF